MRLTIASNDSAETIEVCETQSISELKEIISVIMNIPVASQLLSFNSKAMPANATVESIGAKDGDMLFVQKMNLNFQMPDVAAIAPQQSAHAETLERMRELKSNIPVMARLAKENPPLHAAVTSNDVAAFTRTLADMDKARRANETRRQMAIQRLNANPFDVEAQREIEEAIRQENVERNLEMAMEYSPEAFARVCMLYVSAEVNGVKVCAFVDSGAQSTIMSIKCAERCGIMRLVDKRFAGMAVGVGTAKVTLLSPFSVASLPLHFCNCLCSASAGDRLSGGCMQRR